MVRWTMIAVALGACGGDDTPTSGAIDVLTYNVAGLPDILSGPEVPAAERMAAISPLLAPFDLVGLQEDFQEEMHPVVVGDNDHVVERWFDEKLGLDRAYGAGLSLLARAEELDYFEEHYDDCNGVADDSSDCLASKGFQVLRLAMGSGELDVYNTHHEAGGSPEDDAARSTQVGQVLASLEGRSADRAVLFMGDTNLRWSDPEDAVELQRYADAGLIDACDAVGCPEDDHIDRFLFRDGGGLALSAASWSREQQFVDGDQTDLSDHPAIAMTLTWKYSEEPATGAAAAAPTR